MIQDIRKALETYDGYGSALLGRLAEDERQELAEHIASVLGSVSGFGAMMGAAHDSETATLIAVANRAGIVWTCHANADGSECLWNNLGDDATCLACATPKPAAPVLP